MLAYERFGTGEPLVLVHGISHRRQAWYPVAEQLAEHREVILFDLPGHGESPELVNDGRHVKDILQDELIALFFELDLTARTSPATRSAAGSPSRPPPTAW